MVGTHLRKDWESLLGFEVPDQTKEKLSHHGKKEGCIKGGVMMGETNLGYVFLPEKT